MRITERSKAPAVPAGHAQLHWPLNEESKSKFVHHGKTNSESEFCANKYFIVHRDQSLVSKMLRREA